MTVGDVVVRAVATCASLLLFYVAWCVYEDEERVLQNKIEDWWLQFDDLRRSMLSLQAAFASVVSLRVTDVLNRLFEGRLTSVDSITTAASLCAGSAALSFATIDTWTHTVSRTTTMLAAYAVTCLLCSFALAFWPVLQEARFGVLRRIFIAIFTAEPVIVYLYFDAGEYGPGPVERWAVFFGALFVTLAGYATATGFTLLVVSYARRSLTLTAAIGSEWPILSGLLMLLLVVGLVAVGEYKSPVSVFDGRLTGLGVVAPLFFAVLLIATVAGAIAGIFVVLIVGVAGVMLLHRAAWPLMCRLLYALPRHRILENKKALNTAACALLSTALFGNYFHQLLKYFGIGT